MSELRNFQAIETQTLSVTTSNSTGSFAATSTNWDQVTGCLVQNTGTSLAILVLSTTASPTAPNSAPYGASYPIPVGASFVINQFQAETQFAAICPSGSTTLWLSAGFGN